MPRRNNRQAHVPLDVTPDDFTPVFRVVSGMSPREERAERAKRERRAIERQRSARIRKAIDWSVCLVPGCGSELSVHHAMTHNRPSWRDPEVRLPLCNDHLIVAHRMVEQNVNHPLLVEAATRLLERTQAKVEAEHEAIKKAHLASQDGQIYYVRLNGLIKVGWSRQFYARLKAYGPDVEVLAHYEGTRTDETNLHRQLRPALAKGREWYHDCDIVQAFIKEALDKHGPPTLTSYGWTQPKRVVAGKRVGRRR